jgi:hypothetical protein
MIWGGAALQGAGGARRHGHVSFLLPAEKGKTHARRNGQALVGRGWAPPRYAAYSLIPLETRASGETRVPVRNCRTAICIISYEATDQVPPRSASRSQGALISVNAVRWPKLERYCSLGCRSAGLVACATSARPRMTVTLRANDSLVTENGGIRGCA